MSAPSPLRQVVLLSLLTIGASTLVLSYFVERGIRDREWASTAALVLNAARGALTPADFTRGAGEAEAADRFEEFTRRVRMLPEIKQVLAYDADGEPFWTDSERERPRRPENGSLRQALAGETGVRLEPARRRGEERVTLYVPIGFPGEGRVAGVIGADVDASRVLASVRQARLLLWTLALVAGGVLSGIVWRASRALRLQHAALAQRADELARANAELRQVQRQLVTAERFAALGEITAAVAHGLGNPLAAIRARAQLALGAPPEGPAREDLVALLRETDRLIERMRALLDFGRPVEQRRVPTDLETAVAHALESVRARVAAQSVRLDVAIPPDLPKVQLDPACFEEALLCLVGNGLDAMPGGGRLRVYTETVPPGEGLRLVVEDSGPGMSLPALARAFEPFFTTKPGGTGLGLAVARKLLSSGGALLHLESDPGGTRAVITLPPDER
jgi:two-component system, NtrC family, sensor histidine kinase HydH